MNVTPKRLKEIIEETKVHWMKTCQMLERYEAIIYDHPAMQYIPDTHIKWKEDAETMRRMVREACIKSRRAIDVMEKVLTKDEAENWWKGDERIVEFCL